MKLWSLPGNIMNIILSNWILYCKFNFNCCEHGKGRILGELPDLIWLWMEGLSNMEGTEQLSFEMSAFKGSEFDCVSDLSLLATEVFPWNGYYLFPVYLGLIFPPHSYF